MGYQCQMVSPENIKTSSIIQTEQVIFRNKFVYMHIITTKKKIMNLKEQGGVYRWVWREEREGGNDIISK